MKITDLFNKPRIIGVAGDKNSGKSDLLYHIITTTQRENKFSLYSYGLQLDLKEQKIYSVEELEKITNSVIVIDEFKNLLDTDNKKKFREIERTMRLIHHKNNVIILCGLPENYHKYLSAQLEIYIFKKSTLGDFINNCTLKNIAMAYNGIERGSRVLDIPINQAMIFDGQHYSMMDVPYLSEFDTKAKNVPILVPNKVPTIVPNRVQI